MLETMITIILAPVAIVAVLFTIGLVAGIIKYLRK